MPVKCKIDEIEITPEMIDAGIEVYIDGDEYFEWRGYIVERIFKKMLEAAGVQSKTRWSW